MRVLVTGGAGFIGSSISELFISKGYGVVVLDDLSSGRREHVSSRAKFYKADICSPDIRKIFKEENIDCVVHQAAQVQVRKSLEDPTFDARVNILGSINLLELCRDGVKKIIYASSGGAVYGEPEYLPVDEEHPINPISPYGVSKYVVEKYIEAYEEIYGIDYTILRYGNVYGPRQSIAGEAGVIAVFAEKMLRGKSPTINGDGKQTRDFVYVADVAKANLAALRKGKNSVYNVGSGKGTSVNEVFEIMGRALKSEIKPKFGPLIKGEVRNTYLKVDKARHELGWRPRVEIEEGINGLLDYLKSKG